MTLILSCVWGALYILCTALGFLVSPSGVLKFTLVLLSILFYVPGVLLLSEGYRNNNRKLVLAVRWICIGSLVLTTVLLVAFFLCAAFASATAVDVFFVLLGLFSVPMFSSQYWALSLVLWGCLLSGTFLKKLPK